MHEASYRWIVNGIYFIPVICQRWTLSTMNRLKAIPPRASVMDFSLKQTSKGEVQIHKASDRPQDPIGIPGLSSPRKKQRTAINLEEPNPFEMDDAYVYLDHTASQRGKVCHCPSYPCSLVISHLCP